MKGTTRIKKLYIARFFFRVLIFLCSIGIYIYYPETMEVMKDFNMFLSFSILHVFFAVWLVEIILQFLPLTGQFSIGSLKHFGRYMKNVEIKNELQQIKLVIKKQIKANIGAMKVLVLWLGLTLTIGMLYIFKVISHKEIFLISSFFYLCDLICVLFFCPFQKFLMHNKCCATCRIFNWDHMMMFSPFVFVRGAYTWILVLLSLASMLVWEFTYYAHPERFFEESNNTLKCKNCKEKMCRKV